VSVPIALTIAGSDSSGGAGIQADLKTFSALGVYGASVITALTAQNTREVRGVHVPPADFVAAQIDAVFDDLRVDAVKIGMLAAAAVIAAVAGRLARHGARNVVLDPVMVAKSGDSLLTPDAVGALRKTLVPLANLVTPNVDEAATLLDVNADAILADPAHACQRLHALGAQAVLLKGGHAADDDATDTFSDGSRIEVLTAPRIDTRNTHGTGCTLSSTIAAYLARGATLIEAVRAAKAYVTECIRAGGALGVGGGHGPLHHFHALWPPPDHPKGR
jgi:hydroxymethylpyrimidine/phosphomethylpyrimidine kinase